MLMIILYAVVLVFAWPLIVTLTTLVVGLVGTLFAALLAGFKN